MRTLSSITTIWMTLATALWAGQPGQAEQVDKAEQAERPEVWMMPPARVEDGKCLRDLFAHPEQWVETRSRIDVLAFAGHSLDKKCTDEELSAWFAALKKWDLKLGLEVGALKPWGTTAAETFRVQRPHWDRFRKLGGKIYAFAMDEPLRAATIKFKVKQSAAYAVQETANFVELVRKNYPESKIGAIEPYPVISMEDLIFFVDALQAELKKREIKGIDFFRLDVNWVHKKFQENGGWQEVKKLETALRKRQIPFSLIYWAADLPGKHKKGLVKESNWYESIMLQGREYAAVGGRPDEYAILNWVTGPSRCVPETADSTFTRSVRDFCRQFVKPKQGAGASKAAVPQAKKLDKAE